MAFWLKTALWICFLLAGDTGADIIDAYTTLTGKAPVPPLWSQGVILSKAYYQDADELLATAREVREKEDAL